MKRSMLLATLLALSPGLALAKGVVVRAGGKKIAATLLTQRELDAFAGAKEDLVRATVDALQHENSGGTKRGFHGAPALGVAKVHLEPRTDVSPELGALLSRGIYGEAGTGFARFSSGNPNAKPAPEWMPDVRGFGVVLPNGNLTATNQPSQIVPRGIDFLNFFHGKLGPLGAPFRWSKIAPTTALRGLGRLLVGTQPIPDLLRSRYWAYPTVIGADESGEGLLVARTVFTPVGEKVIGKSKLARLTTGALTIARNLFRPKFQSLQLSTQLATRGAELEVGVQLYRDPTSTPLRTDGDLEWNVPVIPVARLRLPVQAHDAALAQAIESTASFGPQHADNWSAPHPDRLPNTAVGEFQTDRLAAYDVSEHNRGASEAGNQAALKLVTDK